MIFVLRLNACLDFSKNFRVVTKNQCDFCCGFLWRYLLEILENLQKSSGILIKLATLREFLLFFWIQIFFCQGEKEFSSNRFSQLEFLVLVFHSTTKLKIYFSCKRWLGLNQWLFAYQTRVLSVEQQLRNYQSSYTIQTLDFLTS